MARSALSAHSTQHSRSLLLAGLGLALALPPEAGLAQQRSPGAVMLTPVEMPWKPMRAPAGGEFSNLVGGRMQSGVYIERVRYPAHFINHPHSHPDDRTYTVISGTLYVGFGDSLNQVNLKALPPGSFWTEPAGVNHYLLTKEEPVVFQITGMGPSGTTYVDPAHDPR